MTSVEVPPLAVAVGRCVRTARLRRNWTQRDLAAAMRQFDSSWTTGRVGVLETDGSRAERLSSLAVLCSALDTSLDQLLGEPAEAMIGGTVRHLDWVREALDGPVPRPEAEEGLAADRIGAEDDTEVSKLAQRVDTDIEGLRAWVEEVFGGLAPLLVRDALAGIEPGMPLRTVQAKRGHGSRRLAKLAREGRVDNATVEEVREYVARAATWESIFETAARGFEPSPGGADGE